MAFLSLQRKWNEKRREQRVVRDAPIGVAVITGRFPFLVREPQFECWLRDQSMTGLQLAAHRSIPTNSAVKLWVTASAEGQSHAVILHGDVVWSRPGETDTFLVGIRLRDRPAEAMRVWQSSVAERIRNHEA